MTAQSAEASDGQISIIDTKTGQVVGGLGAGLTVSPVPGGAIVANEMNQLRPATREFLLAEARGELLGGGLQLGVGVSTGAAGLGVSATGVGAPGGVLICGAGAVIATNGIISMCNGVKTALIVICNWKDLPSADDAQPLAATIAAFANACRETLAPRRCAI